MDTGMGMKEGTIDEYPHRPVTPELRLCNILPSQPYMLDLKILEGCLNISPIQRFLDSHTYSIYNGLFEPLIAMAPRRSEMTDTLAWFSTLSLTFHFLMISGQADP